MPPVRRSRSPERSSRRLAEQRGERAGKPGKRHGGTGGIVDANAGAGLGGQHGKCHGDSMIAMGDDIAAERPVSAGHDQIIAHRPSRPRRWSRRFSASNASRSLSLTRSSASPEKRLVPGRACRQAGEHRDLVDHAGTLGRFHPYVAERACRRGERAVRLAKRDASRTTWRRARPSDRNTVRYPIRDGLRPTPSIVILPCPASAAAASRKMADDGSPGMSISNGTESRRSVGGECRRAAPPRRTRNAAACARCDRGSAAGSLQRDRNACRRRRPAAAHS